jgi:hypothetical protein
VVTLNGKTGKPSIATGFIGALNDERIISEKGGFLFKILAVDERLILGITPCFVDGVRTYHYDTRLPGEDEFMLIGSVTPRGSFEILFQPLSGDLSPEDAVRYADSYVIFARFLLENGYSGQGRLGSVTIDILGAAGLFQPVPEDLAGLASGICSLDDRDT